ncbi:MAG: hypothetical protein JNM63_14955 [Spirochaetia bacterium]|nr:hypothetical protein [Spirochaetia bacterium]
MAAKTQEQTKVQETIELLLNLQEINQNLDNLVEDIDKLKEEASQEEKKYTTIKTQYDKHYPFLEKTQKEHDQLKIELEEIRKKIVELEESKKKIKTIKEFKNINKDIDLLNKKNAIRENDLLTKAEELDFKRSKIEKIAEKIKETEAVITKKKEDLEALIKERKDNIAKYTKDKEKLIARLPAPMVTTFDRIYKNKFRLAVVAIENQVCQGCYMKISLQVEINVKKSDSIIFCPSCSRILYHGAEALAKSA